MNPDIIDSEREEGLTLRIGNSPSGQKRYAVKAVWRTLQGEGAWAGRPAIFVRLAACNLWTGEEKDRERDTERHGAHCPMWCDTDFRAAGSVKLSADDLVAEILRVGDTVRFVVLTGGEPLLQADAVLISALHAADFEVACETNGTTPLSNAFRTEDGELLPPDWIVCSPKLPTERLNIEWFDELKLVVPDYRPETYAAFAERIRSHHFGGKARRFLWLQPEDGPRQQEANRLAIELAHQHPEWRVSVQTHKILGVD